MKISECAARYLKEDICIICTCDCEPCTCKQSMVSSCDACDDDGTPESYEDVTDDYGENYQVASDHNDWADMDVPEAMSIYESNDPACCDDCGIELPPEDAKYKFCSACEEKRMQLNEFVGKSYNRLWTVEVAWPRHMRLDDIVERAAEQRFYDQENVGAARKGFFVRLDEREANMIAKKIKQLNPRITVDVYEDTTMAMESKTPKGMRGKIRGQKNLSESRSADLSTLEDELNNLTKEFVDDQNGLDFAGFKVKVEQGGKRVEIVVYTLPEILRKVKRERGEIDLDEWTEEAEEHVDLLRRSWFEGFELKEVTATSYTLACNNPSWMQRYVEDPTPRSHYVKDIWKGDNW